MLLYALIATPVALAALSLAMPGPRSLLALNAAGGAALVGVAIRLVALTMGGGAVTAADGFLRADILSAWMVSVVSIVALAASIYSSGYIGHEVESEPGLTTVRRRVRQQRYFALIQLFIASMLFVCVVDNIGYLWIGIEATTLVSVFLVGYYRRKESVEAAWKYLILCSVGIAFALVGTILIYYTSVKAVGPARATLSWAGLAEQAAGFHPYLMKLGFVFILIGYGTKAGLAPLHAWLPDAHSEAPTPVSALLSGVLLKCAIYGILRCHILSIRCVGPEFSGNLLLTFGLLSIVVAAAFILIQRNVKRLLAYSSLEHVGIIAAGFGFGGALGVFGGLFHILNHAMTKSVMFMTAGSIALHQGTKDLSRIRGVGESQPMTAALYFGGTLALAGLPLTAVFLSELYILRAGFESGHGTGALIMIAALAVVFAGLLAAASKAVFGPRRGHAALHRERWDAVGVPAVLLTLVVVLGVTIPSPISDAIASAARLFERP